MNTSNALIGFDEAESLVGRRGDLRLIAIDGLPVAGKSTLAERLVATFRLECIYLDDFVRPEAEWPSRTEPSFPFDYIRYDEFIETVARLSRTGSCSYCPYDWSTGRISERPREVCIARPVVVEGVSALHPSLAPLYDLRFWIESDAGSALSASLARGVGAWEAAWRSMFLPSAMLYLETNPRARADFVVAGRGA
jgi:uridine kinase